MAIYSRFAGSETLRSARNPVANVSILSGDLDGTPADIAGNAYHVVRSNAA